MGYHEFKNEGQVHTVIWSKCFADLEAKIDVKDTIVSDTAYSSVSDFMLTSAFILDYNLNALTLSKYNETQSNISNSISCFQTLRKGKQMSTD